MESLKVQSIVCLVPQKSPIGSSNVQQFLVSPFENKFKLFLNDGEEELSWTVDRCTTPDMNEPAIEERRKLINYALQGYNVSALLLSQIDSNNIFQQRKDDMESLLKLLSESIEQSSSPLLVEYAYIGLTDECIYDLRNDTFQKNETILEKGYDSMLKKVDDINHVWNKIKKGSRLPFLLHFKITDSITMKQGHLQIVDLLQPPFAPPDTPDKYTLHNSFSQLVDIVDTITKHNTETNENEPFVGHLNTDFYVLTDLLSKTLCGQEKTSIFAYFSDRVDDHYLSMVISCMDFLTSMSRINIKMIRNTPLTKRLEYKKLKVKNAELQSTLSKVTEEKKAEESLLQVRDKQINFLEAAYTELSHAPSLEVHKLKTELAYAQGVNSMSKFEIDNLRLEMKFLKADNEDLKARNSQYQKKISEELDGSSEEVKRLRDKFKTVQQRELEYENQIEQLQDEIRSQTLNLKRQYKEKYTAKYNDMFVEFKKKLEALKSSNKEKEAKLKRHYREELEKAKESRLPERSEDQVVENLKRMNHDLTLKLTDSSKTILELKGRVRNLERLLEEKAEQEVQQTRAKRSPVFEPGNMEEDANDSLPTPVVLSKKKNKQPSSPIARRRKIQHVPEDDEFDKENDIDDIDFVKPIRTPKPKKPKKDSETDRDVSSSPVFRRFSARVREESLMNSEEDELVERIRNRASQKAREESLRAEGSRHISDDENRHVDESMGSAEPDVTMDDDNRNIDETPREDEDMGNDMVKEEPAKEAEVHPEPSDLSAVNEHQEDPPVTPKKRGRPKKIKPTINEEAETSEPSAMDDPQEEPPAKPKAKRGRPKKIVQNTNEEAEQSEPSAIDKHLEESPSKPKSKRGRPKKKVEPVENDEDHIEPHAESTGNDDNDLEPSGEPSVNDDGDLEPLNEPTVGGDDDFEPVTEPTIEDDDDFEPPIKPQAKTKSKKASDKKTLTAEEAKEQERLMIERIRAGNRGRATMKQTAKQKGKKPNVSPSPPPSSPPPPPAASEEKTEEHSEQSPVLGASSSQPTPAPPAPQRKRRRLKAQRETNITKAYLTDSTALSPLSEFLKRKGINPE